MVRLNGGAGHAILYQAWSLTLSCHDFLAFYHSFSLLSESGSSSLTSPILSGYPLWPFKQGIRNCTRNNAQSPPGSFQEFLQHCSIEDMIHRTHVQVQIAAFLLRPGPDLNRGKDLKRVGRVVTLGTGEATAARSPYLPQCNESHLHIAVWFTVNTKLVRDKHGSILRIKEFTCAVSKTFVIWIWVVLYPEGNRPWKLTLIARCVS